MTQIKTLPFELHIDVTFWHEFTRRKLEILKLSEQSIPIYGTIENGSNIIRLTYSSFEKHKNSIEGELLNFNTLISFKEANKKELFNKFSEKCLKKYENNFLIPSQFILFVYGDLKKYDFHFIGGCPVPKQHKINVEIEEINEEENEKINEKLKITETKILNKNLEEIRNENEEINEIYIYDYSNMKNIPGWTTRTYIHHKCSIIHCIRPVNSFTMKITHLEEPINELTGWFVQKSTGKITTQIHHLAESMNSELLATQAVELNLQLMKWQLFKQLDLNKIKETKCLLIGSGTLGCNVARVLMGWGVKEITFVDNGRVSYSNPVRQSLYSFKDCVEKRFKSERASEVVKEVFPGMNSEGIVMSIPMPGHPIGEKEIEQTKKDIMKLDELVQKHDCVFLLGDSRECRWLPSMLSSVYNKLCITIGLGFDSFVVMRHGHSCQHEKENEKESKEIKENEKKEMKKNKLSCYFCADIVAPTDSLSRRTLDQQCTVTRPGISYIASALGVEMLISLLHHEQFFDAPASGDNYIPHQLRGYLNTWKIEEGVGSAYSKCIACSDNIIKEYKERGVEMVLEAINNPKSLEKIVGIEELKESEIEILTDSEDL